MTTDKKWTRADMWAWYLSEKVEKRKKGESSADKKADEYYIRVRAVINGDRLIVGFWQGAEAERRGVYYITPAAGHFCSNDGINWCVGKFEYTIFGGWEYYRSTWCYKYHFISGSAEADVWLNQHFNDIVQRWSHARISDYIDDIERQTQESRRYNAIKRKRDRINAWLSGLPDYPSDFDDFISDTVCGGLHFAFGKKNSEGYACSACGGSFKSDGFKHGKFYVCPLCGAQVKCEKKNADFGMRFNSRVMLVQSYHDIKGESCSVKREIYVSKDFSKSGESIRYHDGALVVLPLSGACADGNDVYYYDSGEWSDKNTWGFQHCRCYCYPDVSALEGTAYDKRSIEAAAQKGWYLHYNNLMRCFYDEPRMEYLIKGGFYGLVADFTSNPYRENLMPGNDVQSVLGIDGQGVARLREKNGNANYLKWLRAGFMCGYKLPEATLQYFCKKNITPNDVAVPLNYGATPEKIANYIEKQQKKMGGKVEYVVTTWRDTLNMGGTFGLGGGSYTIFPKDLKKRHNELVGIKNAEDQKRSMQQKIEHLDQRIFGIMNKVSEIEELHPRVKEICERVKTVFEWSDGAYSVLVPSCIQDVMVEGYLLGHCIAKPKNDGTYLYFERIEAEESYICFLRKNENVNAPWYTMEVEPGGAIRQLRTFGDDEGVDREEAKAFLKKWRAKVKSRLGRAELEAAEVSREKRLLEFAELRRNQNKIYRGKLKGLLLVDVLEADFKEFNSDDFAEAM